MPTVRVTIPPCTRKLPGPEPYTMVDLVSIGFEQDVEPGHIEEFRRNAREMQQADLAEQEAAYRRRKWLGHHHSVSPPPRQPRSVEGNQTTPKPDKASGGVQDPPTAPPPAAGASAPPTERQLDFIAALKRHVERGTGEPITIESPATKDAAEVLIDQLKQARNDLVGHHVPGIAQGQEMGAIGRVCQHPSHGKNRKPLTVREWDWSVREHGQGLCRDHQQEKGT